MWHSADSIRRIRPLAVGAAILSMIPLLAEGSPLRQVSWEDLPMVVGKTVQIALPGGAVVTGMEQGAATIGLDLLGNVASEFWPDVKHGVFRCR